ncbi:cyclic-phosphate processing receiver domain-containing protein [Paenibacillus aurantiacus]|uniref:Cyclic-phosphate processing receiver domain-containing protein n=1 Tax=Paenibacillus aurantiacus TaxID=1936118 RepID=A0ABV5KYH9_9BACL
MGEEVANLYLDDLRDCPPGFVPARSLVEAVRFFHSHEVNLLSLGGSL